MPARTPAEKADSFIYYWHYWSLVITNKMADKKALIEQCLSSTKGLRSSVSQIFEDFVSKPISKSDTESSDPVKSSEIVTDLKKHFGNIQKSVR